MIRSNALPERVRRTHTESVRLVPPMVGVRGVAVRWESPAPVKLKVPATVQAEALHAVAMFGKAPSAR